jgi:6-phosphogluconolactonase (cycloisomerase 2 family)
MTNRGKFPFYFGILLVVAGLSIAGCGGNVCGPLGGSGTGTAVQLGGGGKGGDGNHPALFSPAATTTCGTGGGGSNCSSTLTPSNVAYALDATGNVLEYAIDTSGNLALMCTTTPAATAVGGELAVSKNNFLYVLDKSATPQIFSFIIGHANTGTLTPTNPKSLTFTDAKIDGFAHIIADPAGNFVYVTNLDGSNIHVFSINLGSGALTEVVGSPFTVSTTAQPFSPEFLAPSADGKFVFVPDPVNGAIFIFAVGSSGTLTQTASSPFAISTGSADFPGFAVVSASGNFLYTADNGSVAGFSINTSTGALFQLAGSPVTTGSIAPELVVIDESGGFLYAPDFTTNGIIGFTLDSGTGAIGPGQLANSPFGAGISVFDLVANTTGEELFLVAPGTTGEVVSTAPITTGTGELTIPTTASKLVADSKVVIANVQ